MILVIVSFGSVCGRSTWTWGCGTRRQEQLCWLCPCWVPCSIWMWFENLWKAQLDRTSRFCWHWFCFQVQIDLPLWYLFQFSVFCFCLTSQASLYLIYFRFLITFPVAGRGGAMALYIFAFLFALEWDASAVCCMPFVLSVFDQLPVQLPVALGRQGAGCSSPWPADSLAPGLPDQGGCGNKGAPLYRDVTFHLGNRTCLGCSASTSRGFWGDGMRSRNWNSAVVNLKLIG